MTRRRLEDGRTVSCCMACPHETWSVGGPGPGSVRGRCDRTGRWIERPGVYVDSECPLPRVREEGGDHGG